MTRWNAPGRARPDEPLRTWCEAAIPGVCTGRATVRHHIIRRGPGSSDEAWNTLDICNACHDHIHANVTWAKEKGYLRSRPPLQTLADIAQAAAGVLLVPPPLDDGQCPGIGMPLGDTLPDGRRVCMGCGHGFELVPESSGWGGGVLPDHTREVTV